MTDRTSFFKEKRTWHRRVKCDGRYGSPAFSALLEDPDAALSTPVSILKNDPTSTVVTVNVGGESLVIKRTNIRGAMHRIKRSITPSRAVRSFKNALLLHNLGIPTLEPIAFIEERWGPFRGRSYFIYRNILGESLLTKLQQESCMDLLNTWFQKIHAHVRVLHHLNYRLHDLSLSNIIVSDGKPYLIDLDAMRRYPFTLWRERILKRDIYGFRRNWEAADIPVAVKELLRALWL